MSSSTKKKIGKGSFGTVYHFLHEDQSYALKKIYMDTSTNEQVLQKFKKQAKIMKILQQEPHCNIVGFYGEMQRGKYLYILQEFVKGGDLKQMGQREKVRKRDTGDTSVVQDWIWDIITQMALALNHLKKHKIIHRDIKLQNILIQPSSSSSSISSSYPQPYSSVPIYKLTDFGLSQHLQFRSHLEGIAGSPIYLAPQICSNQKYGYEVDVWSLGIAIYQLLHDMRSPYHGDLVRFLGEKDGKGEEKGQVQVLDFLIGIICEKEIMWGIGASKELRELVMRMLQKQPKKRITPLEIMKHQKVLERLKTFISRLEDERCSKQKDFSTKQTFLPKQYLLERDQPQIKICDNIKQHAQPSTSPDLLNMSSSLEQLELFLSSRIDSSLIYSLISSKKIAHKISIPSPIAQTKLIHNNKFLGLKQKQKQQLQRPNLKPKQKQNEDQIFKQNISQNQINVISTYEIIMARCCGR